MKRSCFLAGTLLFIQLYGLGANAQTSQEKSQPEFVVKEGRVTDTATGLQFLKIDSVVGAKDVIEYNFDCQHVRMSPDGRFLLYNNYVVPLGDGDVTTLVDMPAIRSSWSPDGKKIVFFSNGIWIVPVSPETGRPTAPARKILEGDYMYQVGARWSADSRRILFWSTDRQLVVLSVDDGKVTQLTQLARYYYPGEWSPDGRWIAFSQDRDSAWVIPAEGGQARKLADMDRRARLNWSPDGKWVFYQMGDKLHFIRFTDAFEFDIKLPEDVGFYVSWSQDDKKMLN